MGGSEEGEVPKLEKPIRILDPDFDYAPVMLKMESLWKEINDKFLHKENSKNLDKLCLEYTQLAVKLLYLAEVRIYEVQADKVIYAPHPTFYT